MFSKTAFPLSLHYALMFAFLGIYTPFGPIWLDARGLTASQIALVTGATIWARVLFAPFAGEIADLTARVRTVMAVLSIGALLCILPLPFAKDFWTILPLGIGALGLYAAIMPLSETLTLSHTRAGLLDYGRIRLWGSLGFCISAVVMGPIIDNLGADVLPWAMVVVMILVAFGIATLPRMCHPDGQPVLAPTKRIRRSGSTKALLTSPFMLTFLFTCGCLLASHATYFAFSTIHWQRAGTHNLTSGLLWAEALLAEGVLFYFGARIVRRFTPLGLLGIAALSGMVRWAIMAATTDPLILMFSQLLQAGTFACAHLGAMYILARNVRPEMSGRAQAIYSIVGPCLFLGAGIALSGPLYDMFGQRAFLIDVVWSAVGGLGVLVLAIMMRRLPRDLRRQVDKHILG